MEPGLGEVAEMEPLLMMRPPWGDWLLIIRKAADRQ
jgi:hypothetical protein